MSRPRNPGRAQAARGRQGGGSSPEEQSSASAPEVAPRDRMGETSGSCNTRLRGRRRDIRPRAGARGSGTAPTPGRTLPKPPHKVPGAPGSHPQVPSDQGGPLSPSQPCSGETQQPAGLVPQCPPSNGTGVGLRLPARGCAAHPEGAARVGSGVRRLGGKVAFLVALCTASSSSSIHLPNREPLVSSPAGWGGLYPPPREAPVPGEALPIAAAPVPPRLTRFCRRTSAPPAHRSEVPTLTCR